MNKKISADDYNWITEKIMGVADKYSLNRIVSVLEGRYNTTALADSVEAHIRVLTVNTKSNNSTTMD